ncbi:uncharacterized protein HMPREF1541_10977 [Cyphellophora europaea CBS 101466]|uniref:Uncharacterized protein n=1 Tax=Cyphellophora europaea (strain CBS 101466) TaxID=1220924 RepID=W2S583_CYPE1|nr:uncharacterized protein HMPREF1541_10977 [Cyphellophora europaea CBS 101466]ETN43846.1 hypothetical protein HMPREF1541_10977 [Cyphellophora europaea CBS 101466]
MATRGSISRSTEAVRQLFQVEEVTEDMLLKLQEDQNFEWDEDEGFLVLIPTTGGATYEGYERATEQQIRQALKATEEEQEANDLGYRYWLAQTLHYGFRPRFSLKRMQNKFRKILKTEKSLEPPIHLLRLSLRLSDAARNERSSNPAFCIQDIPETLDQLKQEDQDADGEKPDNDAVADEDGEEGHGDENEDSNAEGGDSDKDEDRDSNISADQATELQDVPLSSIESTGRDVSDISETESRDSSEDELDSSSSEDERTYSVYQDGEEDADSDDSESGMQAIRRSIRLSHKSAKKKQLNREQSPSGASGDRRGKRTAAEATVPRSPTTRLSQWRRPRVQVRVPARFDDRDSYPPAASFPSAQTIFDPPRSTSYPSHAIRESDGIVSAQQPSNMGAGVSTESRVGAADPEEREVVLASRSKRSPQISSKFHVAVFYLLENVAQLSFL